MLSTPHKNTGELIKIFHPVVNFLSTASIFQDMTGATSVSKFENASGLINGTVYVNE